MSLLQKLLAGVMGLGAGFLILTNADGFFKAAKGVRTLVGGTIVDVTTGKSS